MRVCIDPGHSGPVEPGACAGGFSEAALVMAIARFLEQELQQRGHQVLRETDCPVVLVECGFISNPIDRAMLSDPLEQWRIAAAIAEGLADWEQG